MRGPDMTPDPHLLPDGSTSWGPDAEGYKDRSIEQVRRWRDEESALEPTEAMVEAAADAYDEAVDAGVDLPGRPALKAAIAAAPPEWLLRAALTNDQITGLDSIIRSSPYDGSQFGLDLKALLSRALRGGEENDG